jgi:hypothetical protein
MLVMEKIAAAQPSAAGAAQPAAQAPVSPPAQKLPVAANLSGRTAAIGHAPANKPATDAPVLSLEG